jgi:hypothetical protein
MSRSRLAAVTACTAVAGTAVFLWLRGDDELARLPPSPFASCTFEELPGREPIGDTLELAAGAGIYAEIRIRVAEELPLTSHGREVQPPERWPVSLWIIPVGKTWHDGYCAGTYRYPGKRGELPETFLSKGGYYWGYQETGYQGKLPRPPDLPEDPNLIVCWTYISTMPDHTEDLIYEIGIHPAATKGKSPNAWRYGKPEILKRGIIRTRAVQ